MSPKRRYRELLVGPDTYRWSVSHQHEREGDVVRDCRETVVLRKDGRPGRVTVVFLEGPGRIVPGGAYTHSGGVARTEDESLLNLHLPRVARALLDVMLARGEDFGSDVEVDGWAVIDQVWEITRPAGADQERSAAPGR
jgi:hypothetical protein